MEKENGFFEEPTIGEEREQESHSTGNVPRNKKQKKTKISYILLAVGIGVTSFFVGFFTCRFSLDKEMRTLIKVKNKIQKEYYEDVSDETFYEAIFRSVNRARETGNCNTEEDFYKAVYQGINNDVLDTYSGYMTKEEYEQSKVQATGRQSGIGLYFAVGSDDLNVYRVAGNSPAEKTGIEKDDTILAVGKNSNSLQVCTGRKNLIEFLSTVADGEKFYLQWRTPDNEVKIEQMQKSGYVENYVYYKTNEKSYGFEEFAGIYNTKMVGEPLSVLNDDTAYIQLTQFNGGADETFDKAMSVFKAEEKKDLVLDLRGNGGGYMNILQSICKYFCKTADDWQPVVSIADYGERVENFCAYGNLYREFFSPDSRITVLADKFTASASECLIGCMYSYGAIDYTDICLVEEDGVAKTYGKGIMQTTYSIVGGGGLKLTTAKIFWPTVTPISIHGVGVKKENGTKTVSSALAYKEQTVQAIQTLYA